MIADDDDDDDDYSLPGEVGWEEDEASAPDLGASDPAMVPALFGLGAAESSFLAAYNSGKLPHAWLLAGPRGIGKASFAWKVAHFLLAADRAADDGLFGRREPASLDVPEDDPSIPLLVARSHSGLLVIERTLNRSGKLSSEILVDQARTIAEFFTLKSDLDGWRVVIIDSADDLNRNAANALLKIVEEPPRKALLLLVSHRPRQLLPTIRSRCRMLRFAPLSPADVGAVLAAQGVPESERPALVALADGSPGTAMRYAGLDLLPVVTALDAALDGTLPLAERMALAESLDRKEAVLRYEAFLDLAGRRLALRIRQHALAGQGRSSDHELIGQLRALTGPASALHDSAQAIVFQTLGLLSHLRDGTAAA
jgi:DNA polymerase III subunit delta'